MSKNLVIVESPAKAKTIEKFLGKDYTVRSSYGHIRDLPKKGLNIDIDNNFTPKYEINDDKRKIVNTLKKEAKDAEVWLASDEDREGEAIAWHLTHALKLNPKTTKRIVFHEITKSAIEKAIQNPRTINIDLVNAQQARRVLDRLVGYELSPVLWKKVRKGLSAGRVQSVAVKLIVDREREIQNFNYESHYKVSGSFKTDNNELVDADLNHKFANLAEVKLWLTNNKKNDFYIADIIKKPSKRSPSAPFTTSTLQQEASQKLSFSVKQTMTIAQRLYENGHITYMRTDSTTLSNEAINEAHRYIVSSFGDKYYQSRQYKTKNKNAQEAHEAIRPTNFSNLQAGDDEYQKKIYQLIWKRTLASQMSDALLERTEAHISLSLDKSYSFIAKGEILQFDGFMKVYGGTKEDSILPPLKINQQLNYLKIIATETYNHPPARYNEASLVRKLEELGIGRPSTYAPTISTIQTRGYIERSNLEGSEKNVNLLILEQDQVKETVTTIITGADNAKLLPTAIAEVTSDFLTKYFPDIVDYSFTATIEEEFDKIAGGQLEWRKILSLFYKNFHPLIEKSDNISRQEASQARLIGHDPKTKQPIYARYGRYGPMLQQGEADNQEDIKPLFAPMPNDSTIDTVTLEQALEMFKLPRLVGHTDNGDEIKANIGRFGPYIQINKIFVSIKPLDPHTISENEAKDLYQQKLIKDKEKNIKEFKNGIKILNGPYGPYITDGKSNARLAKEQDPQSISEDMAIDLLKNSKTKKRSFRRTVKRKR